MQIVQNDVSANDGKIHGRGRGSISGGGGGGGGSRAISLIRSDGHLCTRLRPLELGSADAEIRFLFT